MDNPKLADGWVAFKKAGLESDSKNLSQLEKLTEDFSKNSALAQELLNKPELMAAWKKMDDLGADAAVRQNQRALDALSKPKNSKPDPTTYLDSTYIANHLSKFDSGVVRFTSREGYTKRGTLEPDGGFILPKDEFDRLMLETKGDLRLIEKKLGLKDEYLGDSDTMVVFIERKDITGLKMPSGNEAGADVNRWIPGGRTSGGTLEAVMDFSGKPPFVEVNLL